MSFSAIWGQGPQLREGATDQDLVSKDKEKNEPTTARHRCSHSPPTQNVVQQPSGKAAVTKRHVLIQTFLLQWLTGNSAARSERWKRHLLFVWPWRQRKLKTLFIQLQDMGTYRTLSLPKELWFLFFFAACVGSVCLMDFSQAVCY